MRKSRLRDALAIHHKLGVNKCCDDSDSQSAANDPEWGIRFDEAKKIGQEALEIARQQPEQPAESAVILHNLAVTLFDEGDLAQAVSLARESVKLHRQLQGDNHPETAEGLCILGRALCERGEYEEAEQCYREALKIFLRVYDDSHDSVQRTIDKLKAILFARKDEAGLVALRAEKIERARQKLNRNPTDLDLQNILAWLLVIDDSPELRDGPGAVSLAERAVAASNRQNPQVLDTLAASYAETGQFDKAVSAQHEAISLLQDPEMKQDYSTRLKLFESKAPYRDGSFLTPAKHFRASKLGRHGQWDEAAAGFAELLELEPSQVVNGFDLATLLIEKGDLAGYEKLRQAMLARFGDTTYPTDALWAAQACLLRPINDEESLVLSRLAGTVEGFSQWKESELKDCVVGLLEYRQGHFEKAVERTQKSVARPK